MTKDMLSWELFLEGAKKRKNFPPDKVDAFNRLIAYTKNYFAIVNQLKMRSTLTNLVEI